MELGLTGKKVFITGGASGIGKAIVKEFLNEGSFVVFTSRKKEAIEALQTDFDKYKNNVHGICVDVSEYDSTEKVRKALSEINLSVDDFDVLVNNVGDTLGVTDPFCSLNDWRRIYRLNLEVHIEYVNLFTPAMIKRKWGRVVNITAGAALENSGPVPYCSFKAAYTAYTRSMARVLAETGVVMSAVLPGVVFTENGHWQQVMKTKPAHAEKYLQERTTLKRFGIPQEISPMVVLLASELASFCVGSIVPVEGGQARHYFAGNRESYL